jgi:transcriptional regulator with XRE-family HTH domain
VVEVEVWTGAETALLRRAMRLSVRDFAAKLGVAPRTVSYWEARGVAITPLPETQDILDTAFDAAAPAARQRFNSQISAATTELTRADSYDGAGLSDWAEELERAREAVARQHFVLAARLTERWLAAPPTTEDMGAELYALSLLVAGDLRRDQGFVIGPGSAEPCYRAAAGLFATLGLARRQAQTELVLAVVAEMSGNLTHAAEAYQSLSDDGRLSQRDQARARLWVGTALTKQGLHKSAAEWMEAAAGEFDRLGEVEDWSVAQQKLGLVHRATGKLDQAHAAISAAEATGAAATPLQQVRLWTARGHILLSDRATLGEGESVLEEALSITARYGLGHQRRSIESIRASATRRRAT